MKTAADTALKEKAKMEKRRGRNCSTSHVIGGEVKHKEGE